MRIVLIPILVVAFYFLPVEWRYMASAVIFTVAAITDWLDGYLARRLGQTTAFGAFLDPVADKLVVAVALVLLVEVHASAAPGMSCKIVTTLRIGLASACRVRA